MSEPENSEEFYDIQSIYCSHRLPETIVICARPAQNQVTQASPYTEEQLSITMGESSIGLFSLSILPACMYVHYVPVWYHQRSDEGLRSPGTAVTHGCDLPCGCWELNLGPLQE